MSKALIVMAPHAVDLVREGLQICNNIMEYRLATMQVEIQREQMHREADLALQLEKDKHELEMNKIKQISHNFGITLNNNRESSKDIMQMYKEGSEQAKNIIASLSNPDLSNEFRMQLIDLVSQINKDLAYLSQQHFESSKQSLTAYVHMCDQMRDEPAIFTDVT